MFTNFIGAICAECWIHTHLLSFSFTSLSVPLFSFDSAILRWMMFVAVDTR